MSDTPSRPGTALVTGATAGIGAAFARRLAAAGHDLVLVARDEKRLRATSRSLAETHRVAVEVLPADLTTETGLATVEARLADSSAPVDLLVNNAGMSLNRSFIDSTVEGEERLLRLNVVAVMRLAHAALPGMVARRRGGIINVSSAAAFVAVMPGSTYPATKAWVNSFSESLALAVRPFGVRVVALCPGYVRTEFHQRAGIETSGIPGWLWLDADAVAAAGLRALARDRVVRVVDWRYRAALRIGRLVPRALVRRIARDVRGRVRSDHQPAAD